MVKARAGVDLKVGASAKGVASTYPDDTHLASFSQNIVTLESVLFRTEAELSLLNPSPQRLEIYLSEMRALQHELGDQQSKAIALYGAEDESVQRFQAILTGPMASIGVKAEALELSSKARADALKIKFEADMAAIDVAEQFLAAGGALPPDGPIDSDMQKADDEDMDTRIAKLEVIAENTVKALDAIQRRLDDGFKDVRGDMRIARAESEAAAKELRSEMRDARNDGNTNFKWVVGIQITILLAILGIVARAAKMF
jgi:hypothetical protein